MSSPERSSVARPRLTDENRADVQQYADDHRIPFNAAANMLIRLGLTAATTREQR